MTAQAWQWWLTVLLMGGVTFALRAAPVMLPKSWLKAKLLQDVNAALPLVVLVLLILSGLSRPDGGQGGLRLAAELAALLAVLGIHAWRRNMLLSLAAGIGVLNGILWWAGLL